MQSAGTFQYPAIRVSYHWYQYESPSDVSVSQCITKGHDSISIIIMVLSIINPNVSVEILKRDTTRSTVVIRVKIAVGLTSCIFSIIFSLKNVDPHDHYGACCDL